MNFPRVRKTTLLLACSVSFGAVQPVLASESVGVPADERRAILKGFAQKLKAGYARANVFLESAGVERDGVDLRGLPDGETLILNVVLEDNTDLEKSVFSEVQNRQIYLSLRDVIAALDFPIEYNDEANSFSGWYVRENRLFSMDVEAGVVEANGKSFNLLPQDILRKEDDVFLKSQVLETIFSLELKPNIGLQLVKLDAEPPIPIMEQIARRKFVPRNYHKKPASLPRGDDDYDLFSVPQVDVNIRNSYRKPENGDGVRRDQVNIRTAGEFAYGTLKTSISGDNENQITNARVSYLQESADPEILGPLKARRFEVGDINLTRLPITGGSPQETGVRITNADPRLRQTLPSTQISGYIFPGWDVELYRDNALLAFSETDETGFYSFDNVRLFSDENFFRVVAYGPQGEVREEGISVPYDADLKVDEGGVYDVSLSLQNRNFYNKFESQDQDKNTPHFVGFFEKPLTGNSVLRLGGRFREEEGEQKAYASAGVSASIQGALVNASVASDEDAELASEFSVARRFGQHNFRSDLELSTDEYNPGGASRSVQTFLNRYALEGPFPLEIGNRPRYSTNFTYTENADGENIYTGRTNFNTTYKNFGFNQSLLYVDGDTIDEARVNSQTSISGTSGRNTFRGLANYEIKPASELDSLFASWRRRISPDLESQFDAGYTLESDITSLAAQLNWRPKPVTITPRISYDSTGNVEATLNTRFGVTRDNDSGSFLFTRDLVTGNGTITAFVYLDKNGDKVFNGDDEPIENAKVLAPQNGGGAFTNDKGVAFLYNLRPNIITDVYIEVGSLDDPFWIPGDKGVSIMPRTGTNAKVEIPVHNAGEIDGSVYARSMDGGSKPLRNLRLNLHREDGKIEQTTLAANDGFYLFSLVPPGRYALSIDDAGLPSDVRRPRPQFIEIGYDGTTIFGNDIFLEAGKRDIPSEILADMDDYKRYHTHIDFSSNEHMIALNLGQYKSRLMMSFMWYRLKSRYAPILAGTKLYVPPSQSYALPKTGEHELRVGLPNENLDDAYERCRALVARDFYCKVEIHPTAKQQKFAAAK